MDFSQWHILDGKAEETGETDGFNVIGGGFKRTSKNFRTYIDAECRLHSLALWGRCRSGSAETGKQLALIRLLEGTLEQYVAGQRIPGCFRQLFVTQFRLAFVPRLGDTPVGKTMPECNFPHQTDCQQVGQRVILTAVEFCIPAQVAGIAGPTVNRQ